GLEGAAIVPVSSVTGDGIDELVEELGRLVAGVEERSGAGHARLPIDRVFTLTGHGTIVTGTLWSGSVSPGDKLEVYPAGLPTRIRSVHVHDRPVERAEAGQRTALGLHGVSKDDVTRGDTVGTPHVFHTTHMIDARLRLVPDAKPIKNRTRVHLNIGTSEVLARVILLEGGGLMPGNDTLVQMRLESAILAEKDDLFVIRSYSPVRTIGGGRVIDPIPRRHKRAHEDVLDALGVLESGGHDEVLLHVIGESGLEGISEKKLGRKVDDALLPSVEGLLADGRVRKIAGRLLTADGYSSLRGGIEQLLKAQAADSPLEWGMSAEELRGKLGRDLERSVLDAALGEFVNSGDVSRRGDLVRWGVESVALSPAQQKLATAIESRLLKADALPPTLEVLHDEIEDELGAAFRESEFDAIVKLLASEGRMVKVTSTLFFHPDVVERVRKQVLQHFEAERELGVSSFKDMVGLTRKYAIPLLEFFDSEGITLRSGNVRLKGRKAWSTGAR
ncbi:SelB C-terminal domain-containing protein, partial [bacterium]|nr:SelB C-terminal domain-containing protein [bacterium]